MEQLNRDIQEVAREQPVSVEEQSEQQQRDSEEIRRSVILNREDGIPAAEPAEKSAAEPADAASLAEESEE